MPNLELKPLNYSGNIVFFSDKIDNGRSVILDSVVTDKGIEVEYILKSGFKYPYAGFEIIDKKNNFIDLRKYDHIEVDIKAFNVNHLVMQLLCEDSNVKNKLHRLALRRYLVDLDDISNGNSIRVDISKFKTPDWWYTHVGQQKSDFKNLDLSKLKGIGLMSGASPILDKPVRLKVTKIRIYKNYTFSLSILVIVYLVFVFSLYLIDQKKKNRERVIISENSPKINYKPVNIVEKTDSMDKIFQFINENYTDSELNLVQIAKETGYNQRIISDAIANRFNCNLKTYINQIRITEAKRLLKESDLNMGEVAYAVGFNSSANFNRVFKTMEGVNPTEFLNA